ncbi:MAG TPA: nucleoside-diphosphate kinase [candidate division WOR-3 bacterium]|mgnify:CR=1 FL=1|uniref:Nucleoside-diphosphate kinase n=1 Tax=candidate division WOR-3 bacterium TaxID=2052148 RepID=A0A7V0T5C9_UNCW3|nr:nucleoside-diphosphate kinase [candidate division WOR-3 bacterium]
MSAEATLLLIKPDAARARRIGEILRRLEEAGFKITGLRLRHLSPEEAGRFYAIHEGKPFFAGLVEFISSGPLVAVRLEAEDARRRVREFIGVTDPAQARAGSIRADFGTAVRTNAVHASNPEEDVESELHFFFPPEP